ncbi:MAG: hypothetical protein ACK4M3_03915 [Pyrobaculum sp.]
MEIPSELKTYLQLEKDRLEITHLTCVKCRKKFFTIKDAALHLFHTHGIKIAQKYIDA